MMDVRYLPFLGTFLTTGGVGIQFLRANRMRDRWCILIGIAYTLLGWTACVEWDRALADFRLFVLVQPAVLPGCFGAVFGGTFLVSKSASAAVKLGANPEHPLVPVTNNQGGP